MPGLGSGDLRRPPAEYRIDQRTDDPSGRISFETLSFSQWQNHERIRLVKRTLGLLKPRERRAAMKLIAKLEADAEPRISPAPPFSPASSVAMREWRIRICGWQWSLIAPLNTDQWAFYTIILPKWWVKSRHLHKVRGERLLATLRTALNRAGAGEATGWLYAMIHGQFDGDTKGFPLHVHGLATEGMIRVLRRLRQQPQFRRGKHDRARYPQISISRKLKLDPPWAYLPAAITYCSKAYWLQKNSEVGTDGVRHRVGRPHQISGKHHTRYLLWLDDHTLEQLTLLMGLRVTRDGLVPTKTGSSDAR